MARFDGIAVYMMTDRRYGVLYTGVTSDLVRRIGEHKAGEGSEFSARYSCTRLVWYEFHADMRLAIQREKTIKHYVRDWKLNLIHEMNPDWLDLYESMRPGAALGVPRISPDELRRGKLQED